MCRAPRKHVAAARAAAVGRAAPRLELLHLDGARRAGARAADLMCLDYENEIGTDLAELRHKWRITPAPKQPKRPRANTDEDKDEST